MSSNCEYYQQLMSRMLDGDLMDAETAALREHIRSCRECRALCAAFSSMTLSLRGDTAQPPEELVPGVMARIYAAESEEKAAGPAEEAPAPAAERPSPAPERQARRRKPVSEPAPRSRRAAPLWAKCAAAACLVLIVGGGVLSAWRGGRSGAAADTAQALFSMPEPAAEEAEEAAPESAVFAVEGAGAAAYAAGDMESADGGSGAEGRTETGLTDPLSAIREITVVSRGQAGEKTEISYSDGDSLREVYDLLNALEIGEPAALEPVSEETVEIRVLYDGGKTQSFSFNQGCLCVDGTYYLLRNMDALTDSPYWPDK